MSDQALYIARHGHTSLNGESGTSTERIRGWSDVPLDSRGREQAKKIGKAINKHAEITHIISSDLLRTRQTARLIAQQIICCQPVDIDTDYDLRPWNLGDITGKELTSSVVSRMKFHEEHPEIPVTDGESFGEFYSRWKDKLHEYLQMAEDNPEKIILLVVHSRNILSLPHAIKHKDPAGIPVKGGPGPGSVVKVNVGGQAYTWSQII